MHSKYLHIIYLFLFFILCSLSFDGGNLEFRYGGKSGNKYCGTANIEYYLKVGEIYNKIDLTSDINLNNYDEDVQLIVRVSDLQVGLKKDCSELRNKSEKEVCQLKALFDITNKDIIIPTSQYHAIIGVRDWTELRPEADLLYDINTTIKSEKDFTLKTQLKIFDNHNRKWDIPTVSKKFTVIPKKTKSQTVASTNTSPIPKTESESVFSNIQTAHSENDTTNLILNCKLYLNNCELNITKDCSAYDSIFCLLLNYKFDELEMYEKKYLTKFSNGLCYIKVKERIEQKNQDRLYNSIFAAVQDNDTTILNMCQDYTYKYTDFSSINCDQYEDILGWQMDAETELKKIDLEQIYKQLFPKGKYTDKILQRIEDRKPKYSPIKKGLAKIDFDSKAIVVNKVLGGKKPYYLEFFDYSRNSLFAIKRNRFNKSKFSIDLETLKLPSGSYTVNVVDSLGDKFVVQEGIYISKPFVIPKTIKLSFIIIFCIILIALYKHYISF